MLITRQSLFQRLSSPIALAVKVACILMLTHVGAKAQRLLEKPVDLKVKDVTVPQALAQLSKQNDVQLAYSEQFFTQKKRVTTKVKKQPVADVLEDVLDGTGVGFKELGGQIVLYVLPVEVFQQMTLSGFVEDAETGERLIAASVYCPELGLGTITNNYGFYSITLPSKANSLNFSYIGYSEKTVALDKKQDQRINLAIEPALMLSEVIVTPTDTANGDLLPSPGNMQRFKPDDFKAVPDLGGQSDLFRAMQLLPGMQSGTDGTGGMFVRGGNADQNLVLMDGVPVYNADHLLGMYSIFNTSAIRSAKLLKGGMPARYGGRISSVMDVYTKEGNQNRWSGEVAGDAIGVKATMEGPFANKKGSLMVSGRHTHSDFYLMPAVEKLMAAEDFNGSNYDFYDFNCKVNFNFSEKNKLYLSFYRGKDNFGGTEILESDFSEDELTTKFDWGNTITSLRWNHLFNQKLFSNTSLTYSHFRFTWGSLYSSVIFPGEPGFEPFVFSFFSGLESDIRDFAWKTDFDYAPSANHYFRFGGSLTTHRFRPNATVVYQQFADVEQQDSLNIDDYLGGKTGDVKNAISFDAYAEDEWRITRKFTVNYGLRLAGFYNNFKTFLLPEPRLSAAYQFAKNQKLTASLARTSQYLHRVATAGFITFPGDYWTPSDEQLGPQKAWQGTLGVEGNLPKGLEYSVEAYYKNMHGLLAFPDSFFFEPIFGTVDPEDVLFSIDGKSRGLEVLLRRDEGRLGGWVGYGLSKTTRQSDLLNDGKPFAFAFDRRHEVKLFGYCRLGQRWQVSANWVYGSPNPKATDDGGGGSPFPGELNSQRSTSYHRLDLALSFTVKTGKLEHQLKASAYNAYNRKNVAFYTFRYDKDGNPLGLEPVYLFGFMPGIYYGIKF